MGFPKKGRKERKEFRPDGDRRKYFSNGSDSNTERTMTKVTCDSCGKSCTVPFRPTAGKPVYCSNCFRKDNSGSRGERSYTPKRSQGSATRSHFSSEKSSSSNSRELAQISSKLDRILELLER